MTNAKEVLEDLHEIEELYETSKTKPMHYDGGVDVAALQEYVMQNVLNASLDPKAALWAGTAVKHLLRCGLKDDYRLDLKKAEDYLHRARKGEFLKDA